MPDLGVINDKGLSQGHLMRSEVHLRGSDGFVLGVTRTRSVVKLAGFHGGVQCFVYDGADVLIAKGGLHVYGVDGTWIGHSDRTDSWTEAFGADIGGRAVKIAVVHTWNPDWWRGLQNTVIVVGTALSILLGSSGTAFCALALGAQLAWPSGRGWSMDELAPPTNADIADPTFL